MKLFPILCFCVASVRASDLTNYLAVAEDLGVINPDHALMMEAPNRKDVAALKLSFFSLSHESNGPVFLFVTNSTLSAEELELKGLVPGGVLLLAQTIVIGNRESEIAAYKFEFAPGLPPPPKVRALDISSVTVPPPVILPQKIRRAAPAPELPPAPPPMEGKSESYRKSRENMIKFFSEGGQKGRGPQLTPP